MDKQQINHKAFQNILSNLPAEIVDPSMVLQNGTILLCGGLKNEKNCLQFDKSNWKKHSTFNLQRDGHSAVPTHTATFVFGGFDFRSRKTYEYLPKDSTKWLMGKSEIPGGFHMGCTISAKSEKEIWLIGGSSCERRIIRFNLDDHTFQSIPSQLNVKRRHHRCAFIPNTNKIMITGGLSVSYDNPFSLDSTEILDTEDGSVTMASPMNIKRYGHGIGVVTINSEEKLAVFGGKGGYNGSELYNTQSKKWEMTNAISGVQKANFGFLSVKYADFIPPQCGNCETTSTIKWRRDRNGHHLCDLCGLYCKLFGTYRPLVKPIDERCVNCAKTLTTLWTTDENGHYLCSLCSMHNKLYGTNRPVVKPKSMSG